MKQEKNLGHSDFDLSDQTKHLRSEVPVPVQLFEITKNLIEGVFPHQRVLSDGNHVPHHIHQFFRF